MINWDWANVLENATGNAISDLIFVIVIGYLASTYLEFANDRQNSIGALKLVRGELDMNKAALEGLKTGYAIFRNQSVGTLPIEACSDFVRTQLRYYEATLSRDILTATYVGLGNLENEDLVSKILSLYMRFNHNILAFLAIGVADEQSLEEFMRKADELIKSVEKLKVEINTEIKKIKHRSFLSFLHAKLRIFIGLR